MFPRLVDVSECHWTVSFEVCICRAFKFCLVVVVGIEIIPILGRICAGRVHFVGGRATAASSTLGPAIAAILAASVADQAIGHMA